MLLRILAVALILTLIWGNCALACGCCGPPTVEQIRAHPDFVADDLSLSSATNSGYGARIGSYQKSIKEAMPALKRYFGASTKIMVV